MIVNFFVIFQITSTLQNLERRIDLYGEVVKVVAELIDVKFERVPITRAYTYLIIVGQMFVDLAYIVFLWEIVGYALL